MTASEVAADDVALAAQTPLPAELEDQYEQTDQVHGTNVESGVNIEVDVGDFDESGQKGALGSQSRSPRTPSTFVVTLHQDLESHRS